MKAIKFSESELDFLQSHYELELADAENYVNEIKNILKKLGATEKEPVQEKPVKNKTGKRGRPKKEKAVVVEESAPVAVKPVVKTAPKKKENKAKKTAAKPAEVKAEKAPVAKIASKKPAPKKSTKKPVKKSAPKPAAPPVVEGSSIKAE